MLLSLRHAWSRRPGAVQTDVELAEPAHKPHDREHVFFRDSDLVVKQQEREQQRSTWQHTLLLAYLSLGVIYGDISTALIYVADFVIWTGGVPNDDYSDTTNATGDEAYRSNVLGVFSIIFWILTTIALIKYVLVVLNGSDTGEGGTVALYAHLCRVMGISPYGTLRQQAHQQVLAMRSAASTARPKTTNAHKEEHKDKERDSGRATSNGSAPKPSEKSKPLFRSGYRPPWGFLVLEGSHVANLFRRSVSAQRILLGLVMVATGMAIGDGLVMPAFTVMESVQYLTRMQLVTNGAQTGIVVSGVFVAFLLQHVTSRKVSALFAPIVILWLLSNTAIGIYNLAKYGGAIWTSLNPRWIAVLWVYYRDAYSSWKPYEMLGGAMLCIAGAETMFAAMGRFKHNSVALAFSYFVYPCLVVSYMGQGAHLITHPGVLPNSVFWSAIPRPVLWPMFALTVITALVACQSAIAGVFSLISQSTALGIFPRLRTVHVPDLGRTYRTFIPAVNIILMVLSISIAIGFSMTDSARGLGEAYGVAVMAAMLLTTFLLLIMALVHWDISLLLVVPVFLLYGCIEGLLLVSNLLKVPYGAYVPLIIGFVVTCFMFVWWSGSSRRRDVLIQSAKTAADTTLIRVCTGNGAQAPRSQHTLLPSISQLTLDQLALAVTTPAGGLGQGLGLDTATVAGLAGSGSIGSTQGEWAPLMPGDVSAHGGNLNRQPSTVTGDPSTHGGVAALNGYGRPTNTGTDSALQPPDQGLGQVQALSQKQDQVSSLGTMHSNSHPSHTDHSGTSSMDMQGNDSSGGAAPEQAAGRGVAPETAILGAFPGTTASSIAAMNAANGSGGDPTPSGLSPFAGAGLLSWPSFGNRSPLAAIAAANSAAAAAAVAAASTAQAATTAASAAATAATVSLSVDSAPDAQGATPPSSPGPSAADVAAASAKAASAATVSAAAANTAASVVSTLLSSPCKKSSPTSSTSETPRLGLPMTTAADPLAATTVLPAQARGSRPGIKPLKEERVQIEPQHSPPGPAGTPPSLGEERADKPCSSPQGALPSLPEDTVAVLPPLPTTLPSTMPQTWPSTLQQNVGSLGISNRPVASTAATAGAGGMDRAASTSDKVSRSSSVPAAYVALRGSPDKPLHRVTGLGLYYGESPVGMPLVMKHFLRNVDAIHEVCIILIVRLLPMPSVRTSERLLVRPVKDMPNFYQVVARYGYKDKVDHSDAFVSKLVSTLMNKLELKAGLKLDALQQEDFIHELECDDCDSECNRNHQSNDGVSGTSAEDDKVFGLAVIRESYLGEEAKAQEEIDHWQEERTYSPFISRYALECFSRIRLVASARDATQAAKDALAAAEALLETASTRVVHYRIRTFTIPSQQPGVGQQLYSATIGSMYSLMERVAYSDSEAFQIPFGATIELGIAIEI